MIFISKITKKHSQRTYLFAVYGVFLGVLLTTFFFFTYKRYQENILRDSTRALENMCASVENSVENQLENMSTISMNIVYSNAIKSNFKDFSSYYRQTQIDSALLEASREKASAIQDIITAIIGAHRSATDVRIYTLDGSVAGYWLMLSTVDLEKTSWYADVMKMNGHMYITNPMSHSDIPSNAGDRSSQKYISLVRLFLDSADQPEGIVEVIQDCSTVFSLAQELTKSNPDSRICIYNSRHELVYPFHGSAPETNYYKLIKQENIPPDTGRFLNADDGRQYLFTYRTIPDYNWTVVLIKEKSAIYAPLRNFKRTFAGIAVLSVLIILLICYGISRWITAPLQKLTNATGKITITRVLDENKVNLTSANSNIRELSMLCESIREMYEKLRNTSQEILLSRSEETRAKLQATQSIVNPHFLYNSLTNICVMAEEDMNDDIIRMCRSLCNYFRYVSSSGEMIVKLEKELFYTKCYLECMQLRFAEEFHYQFLVGTGTETIYIPKLIIQPIVENAFKYAFEKKPPWDLLITSYILGDKWFLEIQDNGGNMTEEKKNELLHLYESLDLNRELKSMEIGGMGLKNVYLRLKLLYQEQAVFEINTEQTGKTVIRIGGSVYYSKEAYYEWHPRI